MCALSAFFSSDFKVSLLPKGAFVTWGERARGARLALEIKQIHQSRREAGKGLAGCPAGTGTLQLPNALLPSGDMV